jgi:hypothetical protein
MGADTRPEPAAGRFDYAAFKSAFETRNIETWLSLFDENAEWIEYRHDAPSASPNRMRGKSEIGAFLARVKSRILRDLHPRGWTQDHRKRHRSPEARQDHPPGRCRSLGLTQEKTISGAGILRASNTNAREDDRLDADRRPTPKATAAE